MRIEDIRRVLILGAGTMGQQIGFVCAMHGYDVMFYDIDQEILEKSMRRIEKLGSFFVGMGRITQEQLSEVLGRISGSTDSAEAARDVDFVSESVPEDPDLKAKVFAQFNDLCPERTIFTTNTSMLVPSMFAAATGRPEKFAALHFHDVRISNVVDIMPHPGTSEETTRLVEAFAKSIGQIAIMLHKENNGYVFNTMLSSLFFSALTLASRDVASVEDIDRSWMGVMHTPIGPFGIMDQVGLKTVWTITDYWAKKVKDPQAQVNADFVKKYVDKGRLGAKTMQGFYSYPGPAFGRDGFLTGDTGEEEE
jgi:3-hydroxybutyryl-CoA dehydrogenase